MAENTHCLRVYSDRISKGKPRKRFDITPVIYIFVKTDTMKERIERILKEKSLSSNKLAEMLEVQPSGISHILSGRNKPSMDFITKLLTVGSSLVKATCTALQQTRRNLPSRLLLHRLLVFPMPLSPQPSGRRPR